MSDDSRECLFGMIEALLRVGAEIRVGKRRVQIRKKDASGLAEIACNRSDWDSYAVTGRIMPLPTLAKDRLR